MKPLLTLLFTLLTYSALACECKVRYSMAQNFKDAALVAEVEVIGFNDTMQIVPTKERTLVGARPPFSSGFKARLQVLKVYKGTVNEKTIALSNNQECSDRYTLGQKYVLFVYRGKDSYYTRICEKNFPASDQTSLQMLKALLPQH